MHRYVVPALALAALVWGTAPTGARAAEDSGQHKTRVALGVQVEQTPKGADHEGALVRQVAPDSAAAKAGLRKGDVISRADGHEVDDPGDLIEVLADHKPGDKIDLRVWRDGKEKTLPVTLEERRTARTSENNNAEENREATGPAEAQQRAFLGVEAVPNDELTDRLRKRLDVQNEQGVVVFQVLPDSPASRAGLRHGDVITGVNGKDVDNLRDLRQCLDRAGPGKEVTLDVARGDHKRELRARLEEPPVDFFGTGPEERTSRYGNPTVGGEGATPAEQERLDKLQRQIERLQDRVRELEQHQKQSRE